jgi:outer membrane protein assembly complex protein YaeT
MSRWSNALPACGLAIWLLLGPGRAGAVTVDELPAGERYRVARVRIEGARAVGASAVRDAMVMRRPAWYLVWQRLRARVEFSETLFRGDLERVGRVLRQAGYYEADIEHDLIVDGAALTIVLRIDEGPPVLVGEVALVGDDVALTDVEEGTLRALLALAPGDVFTQAEYDADWAVLTRHYAEASFAYVQVAKAATVDVEAHRADVTYTIHRGPPAVLGTTTVVGLESVGAGIVLRELRYGEGDSYDPRMLEESHARIFGLRLFRVVTVAPRDLTDERGVVDVLVTVTEGLPREVRVGVGYGTEDGPRAQLHWQHYNFFGGGRQLGFQVKASEISQEFGAEFRQPYFLHPQQTLIVPLTQGRVDEPGYTNAFVSLAPRVERTLTPTLRVALGFGAEYDDLSDVPDATVARLDEFRSSGFVFGPLLWIEHNTADDLVNPRHGGVSRLTFEQAGGPWQGGYTFVRGLLDVRRYLPLGGRSTLASRLRLGAGDGFGDSRDLPIFRRFYAGGIDSTRGYRRHRVGPLNEFGSPVGGRSLLEASLEVRMPIRGPLGGALFADAGQVRRAPFSFAIADMQYGVGAGVRYQTPVGPLRVDIGIPIDPPRDEPSWRLHFSIGHSF